MKTRHLHISTIALNFALREDGQPPEWVLLVPAGEFEGVDGRRYLNADPQRVIQNILVMNRNIPWDTEHSTEIKAPKGEEAGARGWTDASRDRFDIREGAVWGRVEFNAKGIALVGGREYRTYSPAYYCEPSTNPAVVVGIKSIGLTNTPNLALTALNREENPPMNPEILKLLGLADAATDADVLAAIRALQSEKEQAVSMNRQLPNLADYVPKATYDLALNRAATAEKTLIDKAQADLDVQINAAVDGAIQAGKIAPANRDFYVSVCRAEGGLIAFKAFAESAPAIIAANSGLGAAPPVGGVVTLNAEERYVADQLGISHDEYKKAKEAK